MAPMMSDIVMMPINLPFEFTTLAVSLPSALMMRAASSITKLASTVGQSTPSPGVIKVLQRITRPRFTSRTKLEM